MKTLAQHPEQLVVRPLAEKWPIRRSLRTLMDGLRSQGPGGCQAVGGFGPAPIGLDVLEAMEQALDDHHEFFELARGQGEARTAPRSLDCQVMPMSI